MKKLVLSVIDCLIIGFTISNDKWSKTDKLTDARLKVSLICKLCLRIILGSLTLQACIVMQIQSTLLLLVCCHKAKSKIRRAVSLALSSLCIHEQDSSTAGHAMDELLMRGCMCWSTPKLWKSFTLKLWPNNDPLLANYFANLENFRIQSCTFTQSSSNIIYKSAYGVYSRFPTGGSWFFSPGPVPSLTYLCTIMGNAYT